MSAKSLAKIDTAVADRLRSASEQAMTAFSNAQGGAVDIVSALDTAQYIAELRELFDVPQIKDRIVALQDTPIGFRTDKDPRQKKKGPDGKKSDEYNTPYAYPVVRDCAIEATLRGLQMVGNQWNIISYRCYVTKEGFEALIRKVKGLTDFAPVLDVPRKMEGGAIVHCVATWSLNGKPGECKAAIPVRTDAYSSADQTLGKAARKFLKRCYEQMTGVSHPDGEEDDISQSEPTVSVVRSFRPAKRNDDPAPATEPTANPIPTDTPTGNRETDSAANREPSNPTGGEAQPAPAAGPVMTPAQSKLAAIIESEGCTFDTLLFVCGDPTDGISAWRHIVKDCSSIHDMRSEYVDYLVSKEKSLRAYLRTAKEAGR